MKISKVVALSTVALAAALPTFASADRWHREDRREHRQEWKGLGLLSGAVGLVGLASHNSTLAAVGLGGALYSGIRYGDEFPHRDYRYDHRPWNDHRWDDRRYDERYRHDDRRHDDRYGRDRR